MKLSKKSEYACLSLIDLSENYDKECVKIAEIVKRKEIPKKFLEQILLSLKNAGYVRSKKGSSGGYKLSKKPNEITLAEIIRLMDGPIAPVKSVSKHFYENTPIEKSKKLIKILIEIRDFMLLKLEHTTFADLIK
ncbi:MAG: Rrf2 family transcriptional regulator [Bacteroidales bacterium]|jgi:Rrf2 family protein